MSANKTNVIRIIRFVELYRDAEDKFRNVQRPKSEKCIFEKKKKICDEMDIDCFNIREVARKTKNIRSAYYRGLKKK